MTVSAFEKKLAELREEYARRLPERIDEALGRLDACVADPADGGRLVELRRVLHTLAGNAGTFGRAALGQKAKQLEHEVAALEANAGRTAADIEALRPAIASLPEA